MPVHHIMTLVWIIGIPPHNCPVVLWGWQSVNDAHSWCQSWWNSC